MIGLLRNRKGFTLLELILVIAVIALLVGIVAPRFTSQIPKAESATIKANLQNLRSAVEVYRAEKGGFPASLGALVPDYMRTIPTAKIKGMTYQFSYTSQTGTVSLNVNQPDFEGRSYSQY